MQDTNQFESLIEPIEQAALNQQKEIESNSIAILQARQEIQNLVEYISVMHNYSQEQQMLLTESKAKIYTDMMLICDKLVEQNQKMQLLEVKLATQELQIYNLMSEVNALKGINNIGNHVNEHESSFQSMLQSEQSSSSIRQFEIIRNNNV